MGLSETRPHFQYMFFPMIFFWGGVSGLPWFTSFFTPFFWSLFSLCSLASQIRFPVTSGGPGQHDSLESLAAGQLWIEFASAPGRTGTTRDDGDTAMVHN